MQRPSYRFDFIAGFILIFLTVGFFFPDWIGAQRNESDSGFIKPLGSVQVDDDNGSNRNGYLPISDAALWSQQVEIDASQLNQPQIRRGESPIVIQLPDENRIRLNPSKIESDGEMTAWSGSVNGTPHGEATFISQNGVIAGTINTGSNLYRIRYTEEAGHLFEELNPDYLDSAQPIIPEGIVPLPDDVSDVAQNEAVTTRSGQPDTNIDLLILYTSAAERAMGGPSGTQATLNLAMLESNQGLDNSNIDLNFRLVHTEKVDLVESNFTFSDLLTTLRTPDDGIIDDIHAIRDRYGADVVSLIVDRPVSCGKAYQMVQPMHEFDDFAFSVIHQSCVTGYYSLAHEIGHNLGSQHDHANVGLAPGIFDFSYGYQDPDRRFRTIMAYRCVGGCVRINHWSNPSIIYNNFGPTGVSTSRPFAADNRHSLRQTAPIVAGFRDEILPEGDVVVINFQSITEDDVDPISLTPSGNNVAVIDTGESYQTNDSGYTFGWVLDRSPGTDGVEADLTNQIGAAWEIALPKGMYRIRVQFGNPDLVLPNQGLLAEGAVWKNETVAGVERVGHILEGSVEVVDGNHYCTKK